MIRDGKIFRHWAHINLNLDQSIGQWKNRLRWGRGREIWKEGAIYDGYWKENKANGKGRMIHAEGGVYVGDWVNEKAQGKGVFIQLDGAVYEGDCRGLSTWERY
eukprot:TRINITY_DN11915_c0_g1_i1.p1 TRINITY_DN11915_c0_g1~~TRINITY_DN11915_c0_g1_i1.p1  ORF type:complete len:104 (-),score=23.44 TRINITY_DN11915_c0_g1_i1:188-499(-)